MDVGGIAPLILQLGTTQMLAISFRPPHFTLGRKFPVPNEQERDGLDAVRI